MPLPPSVTRALLKATCDKTALDRKALRLGRSFREVNELLGKGDFYGFFPFIIL